MSQAAQEIIERIERLAEQDHLALDNYLAKQAESAWKREANEVRRLARGRGIDQATMTRQSKRFAMDHGDLFDTNVHVAEALLGAGVEAMIAATVNASWRILVNSHVLNEVERVFLSFPNSVWERNSAKLCFADGGARETEFRKLAFPNRVWEREAIV